MSFTMLEKIWRTHLVKGESTDAPGVLYIDLHLLNEVTSPQAFDEIQRRGLVVHAPERSLSVIDHSTPTLPVSSGGRRPYVSQSAENQVSTMEANAKLQEIRFLGWDSPDRGIVHVVGPELGLTLPGMTIVCGDSHTSTHGAFGALAFGIGTSEVTQVLATQCLLQRKPKAMRITLTGVLAPGVSAKDIALHVVTQLGANGATGYVIEFAGEVVSRLSMEGRMTLCNMSIECGARAGLIAPDETTFAWLKSCPEAPVDMDKLYDAWRDLQTDSGAVFDREETLSVSELEPMVTWGVTPDTAIKITGHVPHMDSKDPRREVLDYMGMCPGDALEGLEIDYVFIGSCTNARLADLRVAASILEGRQIASGLKVLVVPGSESVRRAAEAEGLHQIFLSAGAEWRLSGCSMCLGMNGDLVPSGKRVVSTSNRNFIGRQGKGARSILASPATAAASAIMGSLTDPRRFMR